MSSIEEIVGQVDSTRCVAVEIRNNTKCHILTKPSTFCESGYVFTPPAPTIPPGTKDHCIYIKVPKTACGSVGLLVYHVSNCSLVIMFSNPFDYLLYRINYGLYITDPSIEADKPLFKSMYYNLSPTSSFQRAEIKKDSQTLVVTHASLRVSATMSNNKKAIIKIDIEDL
ncbi:DELTA-thalatoxin-Avl1a-like [Rhinatrema bivittatum]|uniref:DELTA-thalatoxin-Avl1a-like n=1 Tax=Rhinatrema bivittatum TaxID=194408 RepID=UPI00112C1D04|nr:DELTA-thalatoxin-Avl1a-like [Rhinatrema bivittatum]